MFLKILKWFGLFVVSLVLIVFVINAFDQDIRPEANAFADFSNEQIPSEQNAYFSHLGHTASLEENPHNKGIEIVDEFNRLIDESKIYDSNVLTVTDRILGPKQLKFRGNAEELCKRDIPRCLPAYREKKQSIEQLLSDNQVLVERYYQLYSYPHYLEVAKEVIGLSPINDANTYQLIRAKIGLQANNGRTRLALQALQRDIGFWRLVLRDARTLIVKMIATARIKRDLGLVSEIISARSISDQEMVIASEILAPLNQSELDLSRVFRSEFSFSKNIIMKIPFSYPWGDAQERNDWWSLLTQPFFKRQATINLLFERHRGLVELASLSSDKFIERLSEIQSNAQETRQWIDWRDAYNPIGKWFTSVVSITESYANYIVRVRNLDARLRLINLQLIIRQNKIADHDMARILEQANARLFNPYTLKPAQWESQDRSIFFLVPKEQGRTDSTNENLKIYL